MDNGISLGDLLTAMNSNKESDNFGGFGKNPVAWIIVLFIIFAALGDGGLFGGGKTPASTAFTSTEFSFNNLERQIQNVNDNVTEGNYKLSGQMGEGFGNTQRSLDHLGYQMQDCCCNLGRAIDGVRYEAAKNTCDITNAVHAEGEATRALINQNTMQELRDQLQTAQAQLSNQAQTSALITALRPFPQPAYVTCSPYASAPNCGCGCGC